MTTTPLTRDEKKAGRAELRELRDYLKVWTLKAPGLHPGEDLVCREHRRRSPLCESCAVTLYRKDRADGIRAAIRTLTDRLNGRTTEPKPEPATRKATVITGRGKQLVMFV